MLWLLSFRPLGAGPWRRRSRPWFSGALVCFGFVVGWWAAPGGQLLAPTGCLLSGRHACWWPVAARWRFGARILIFCRTAADAGRREAVARRFPQKGEPYVSVRVQPRHAALIRAPCSRFGCLTLPPRPSCSKSSARRRLSYAPHTLRAPRSTCAASPTGPAQGPEQLSRRKTVPQAQRQRDVHQSPSPRRRGHRASPPRPHKRPKQS